MQGSPGHYVSVTIIHHSIELLLRLFGFDYQFSTYELENTKGANVIDT